jgi:DNA replication and repair protein RecF
MDYMFLRAVAFQHFRSYEGGVFRFGEGTTVVVGENAAGKTNFLEGIYLLAAGKSFRAEKDWQLLAFGETIGRVKGVIVHEGEEVSLEVTLVPGASGVLQKRYLVNGVGRRRVDFAGNLLAVLFVPDDMDIVSGSPSLRRNFLDEVLEQVDLEYRLALATYTKALRQRNALLEQAQESGVRNEKLFSYWDELLITNGSIIHTKRDAFIAFINARKKEFFPFTLMYDASLISRERLDKYRQAEMGAGVTLVGPHRDDMFIRVSHVVSGKEEEAKFFASRGQQRLIVLELKLCQIAYIEAVSGQRPMLLLDDIFSELDSHHIVKVLEMVRQQQTVITTTHKEFVEQLGEAVAVISVQKTQGGSSEQVV